MDRDIGWDAAAGDWALTAGGAPALVEGGAVVASDLLARLSSPAGTHWAHPDQGADVERFVQAGARMGEADDETLLELRQDVELECQRHRAVLRADVEVATFRGRRLALTVRAALVDGTTQTVEVKNG